MPTLTSIPTECLLVILQSCDSISQATALSSICRQSHSVYVSNKYAVLAECGKRDIPAFNESLMAVRATNIVMDHFHKGQFPPKPFPLSIGVESRKPSSEEMRQVFDWEHLIRCIEDICLHNTEWGRESPYFDKTADSETPSPEWLTWRQNFRRSMYRSLMMGAVLCAEYQEPVALSNKDGIPKGFLEDLQGRIDRDDPDEPFMRSDEMAYLLKHPVFNFEAYDDHHSIYGQLAEFLQQQTENHRQVSPEIRDMYPEYASLEEVARDHAVIFQAEMVQCLKSCMTLSNHCGASQIFKEANKPFEKRARSITIIRLGSFYPEHIAMPANPHHAHQMLLLAEPLPQNKENTAWNSSSHLMDSILGFMHHFSGQPNHYAGGFPTPPPPLQVFQYVARRFLGLRFSDEAFDERWVEAAYIQFAHYPQISGIFLDEAPDDGSMFDTLDGEGQYNVYYGSEFVTENNVKDLTYGFNTCDQPGNTGGYVHFGFYIGHRLQILSNMDRWSAPIRFPGANLALDEKPSGSLEWGLFAVADW